MIKLYLILCIAFVCCCLSQSSPLVLPTESGSTLVGPFSSFSCPFYSASNTNYDTQGYSNCSFVACGGTSFSVSGCGCSGDQFLMLYLGNDFLSASDDYCDHCSYLTYSVSGDSSICSNFTIREGCYQYDSCSGTVIVSGLGTVSPSVVPTVTPSPSLAPSSFAPSSALLCPAYNASNTNYDTQNYSTCAFTACGDGDLIISACGCDGDTYLRLFNSSGNEIDFNDDASCALCSSLTYSLPGYCAEYTLREGCYGSDNCSATVSIVGATVIIPIVLPSPSPTKVPSMSPTMAPSVVVTSRPSVVPTVTPTTTTAPASYPVIGKNYFYPCPKYSASNTDSANQHYSTCSFIACGGTTVIVSGCGCSGDQFLQLYDSSGFLTDGDEECGQCAAMAYTVPGDSATCSTFTIHEGCYSSESCSGTVAVYSYDCACTYCDAGSESTGHSYYYYNTNYYDYYHDSYYNDNNNNYYYYNDSYYYNHNYYYYSYYYNDDYYFNYGTCQYCAAGSYSKSNSYTCEYCNSGLNSVCESCPYGMTSNVGSTKATDCANPGMNSAIAFFLLILSAVGLVLYIIGGRLQRMAFVRKIRLIDKSKVMVKMALQQLLNAGSICTEISNRQQEGQLTAMAKVGLFLKTMGKRLFLFVFFVFVVCAYFLSTVLQVFFTSLLLWRGYSIKVSYLNRIKDYTNEVLTSIHLKELGVVFYPFLFVLNAIASVNLNFSTVQVNCLGSQSAIQFFMDCVVVGIVVIIIQSEMMIYWGTFFAAVKSKYYSLLFQRNFWKSVKWNIWVLLWSILLDLIPNPRKILQYGLVLVRVMVFFENYGMASSSINCDQVIPIGSTGADTLLAYFSTVIAYAAICPIVYLFSQVLVPKFKLQSGTVRAESNILQQAKRNAEKISKCGRCSLGLHRHYTSHFGEFHCDCLTHSKKPQKSLYATLEKVKCSKNFVVYGCPSMTVCNWAICEDCYESSLDSSRPVSMRLSVSPDSDSAKQVVDEVIRMSVAEKQAKWWTWMVPYLKFGVMLASLDWFYIKLTFEFAKAIYVRMLDVNDELIEDLNKVRPNSVKLESSSQQIPILPWFHAIRHWNSTKEQEAIEENEELNLQYKWYSLMSEFPTYYRMVLTVQEELLPKHVHKGVQCGRCKICPIVGKRFVLMNESLSVCELCKFAKDKYGTTSMEVPSHEFGSFGYFLNLFIYGCIAVFSWTLPVQLYSERGRRIWIRVGRNYLVFVRIVFGLWTDKAVRDFNLLSHFDDQLKDKASFMEGHKQAIASVNIPSRGESSLQDKVDRMQLVSALVSSRVVLIQLIPYLTFVSTLAVDISSSPIFVYNDSLLKLLPPFILKDSTEAAIESLKLMDNDTELWKVKSMAVYLCVKQSRSIQFVLHLCINLIALILMSGKDKVVDVMIPISAILFLLVALVYSIYPFIMLHKLLFPPGDEERKDRVISVTEGLALQLPKGSA